jgi:single-strand DNA-binding protein
MRTINRSTVLGCLGADPVLRYTKSGMAVTNLRLATSVRRKEGPEETTWHRVVLWDKQAELAEKYLRKGNAIYVEGRLSESHWEDSDGKVRRSMELIANELVFMPRGVGASTPRATGHSTAEDVATGRPTGQIADGEEIVEVTEDVPF